MTTLEPSPPGLEVLAHLSLPQLCGQLIVVGIDGTSIPEELTVDLAAGLRAGVILFRRNLPSLESTWMICRQILAACDVRLPPLIAVDQEGGRVTRLPEPIRSLPSMRRLAALEDVQLIERAAELVGKGLCSLGFNCNFAPVLDVDSNPLNPVIGDRSFSSEPHKVAHFGMAFARGLSRGGILACGKHFPGHGDTLHDSHLELPLVSRTLDVLERVEFLPFRDAVSRGIDALMTAHVVFTELDASVPATLSRIIISDLLRKRWGYDGLVISDDLEMAAICQGYSLEASSVSAIRAGCDVVLVCRSWQQAGRVLDALVGEAECDPIFGERVCEAARRSLSARVRCPPRAATQLAAAKHILLGASAQQLFDEVESRLSVAGTKL